MFFDIAFLNIIAMKKNLLLLLLLLPYLGISQVQNATFTISPSPFDEDEQITITVSNVDPTLWNAGEPDNIYLWAWYFDQSGSAAVGAPNNGDWTNSSETQKFTNNGDGTYSYTLTPDVFYGTSGISQMGMLVKAKDGTGDKKSQDNIVAVGRVQLNITNPNSSPAFVNNGGDLVINANMTVQGMAEVGSFEVFVDNVSVATGNGFPNFSTTLTNLTSGGIVKIVGSPFSSSDTGESTFDLIIAPTVIQEAIPSNMEDGINYNSSDTTKATLVLDAPNKDFVYIAGSFNNYNPTTADVMKQDPSSGKFWLELTGLTSGQIETYQYWVADMSPIANSPSYVKTADPYSTIVLSPFDDPSIPSSTYPNLPVYPAGQEREVTVLQTGQTDYPWQVTNFQKPKKEDLVIYEVLVRDFDSDRNFQDLIDKIDYFKNLNINAIQLMPVMEFEGNESWGYNTSYHMALDKFYGTENKLKEFIDLCHQNDIAVILDIALNHAFGRNPLVRMWMDDPDNDGWGEPSSENPYLNEDARHSYNVGYDFDHSNAKTKDYTKRVVKHWVEEFKIDGFRWDLTKGFTQNCTANDENCTNAYQADRVAILKEYADYSWSLDPTHYVIFEHLGVNTEEKEWADYRVNDAVSKGIMLWGKMTTNYNQLTMGFNSNNDINGVGHDSRNFIAPRLIGYAESHDEERLMYKNLQFGQQSNPSHDVRNLNTALSRMSALGAVTLAVPGPKMIWHFGTLGMENSIYTCNNGSVNTEGDATAGDCKLDTKPQPQWTNNWLADTNRNKIYNDWARINLLKTEEAVFEGNYSIDSGNLTPRIFIWDDTLPSTALKNVVILANFDVTSQNITPDFPYTGIWYDLMDPTGATTINITNVSSPLGIAAGQFKMYGNAQAQTLSTTTFSNNELIALYPNPTQTSFSINRDVKKLSIYDVSGKLIKTFKGDFTKDTSFNIQNISKGLYLVQIENELGATKTTKLIKL